VKDISKEENKAMEQQKKEISKAYGKYVKKFTPSPNYVGNGVKAFLMGGAVCTVALWVQNRLTAGGLTKEDAGTFVTIGLVMVAQLLTGLGVFDSIAKVAGAGVIVPITGFANSMVAPAIEYKKEGPVLGVGAKMFSVAGPVLVCGISSAVVVGVIYWILGGVM
jgi:stage V sporulation protein AC